MVKTARTNPAVFFATCARLIPNNVRVTVQQQSLLAAELIPTASTRRWPLQIAWRNMPCRFVAVGLRPN